MSSFAEKKVRSQHNYNNFMNLGKKRKLLQKRRWRIRKKIVGTEDRPRLTVRFTNKNIHVQCVNDTVASTLVSASSNEKDHNDCLPNISGSSKIGTAFGKKLKNAGINTVVFDRAGRKYHGCVKAFADAVRSEGLEF